MYTIGTCRTILYHNAFRKLIVDLLFFRFSIFGDFGFNHCFQFFVFYFIFIGFNILFFIVIRLYSVKYGNVRIFATYGNADVYIEVILESAEKMH